MKESFASEKVRRKEDYKNLEENVSPRMEGDFKNELQARQQARQQIQDETMQGFKNEELQGNWFKKNQQS